VLTPPEGKARNGLALRVATMVNHVRDVIFGRERVRRLERRVHKLERDAKERNAEWERDRAGLKRASASRHRRVLSPDVVHDLLPLRARTIGARARYASAERYEAWFREMSTTYSEALDCATEPHPHLVRTTLQGLTWWVPVPPSLGGETRERFIAKQRFPYRNITQTREFAVGSILLDIGANIGRMSIPRVILGDVERAYCAEPDPLNFTALVRNISSNGLRGLVLPDRVAIGAACGTVRLPRGKYPSGHRLLTVEQADDDSIEVPCVTLDEWCRRLSIDPDLVTYVKVDTQGWEAHVLRGASRLLECPHIAWQIEVTPSLLDAAGSSPTELYELCAGRFSHFIGLGKKEDGPRVRSTGELSHALGHLRDGESTDIVLFNASERLGMTGPADDAEPDA
jgi:FkbM family methyltransferase